MVTRNDVARTAGVSTAVVSYVINDGPRSVSPRMRSRVLAAIEELGYRPNSVARSMRTRRTNSIGFVIPEISMAYFSSMTQFITEIARKRGLSVVVATSNGDVQIERDHLRELSGRQVDGVILMSVDPEGNLEWANSLGMPVLVVDRPNSAADSTTHATQHLIAHNRRHIARLTLPESSLLTRRRDEGWARALAGQEVERVEVVRVDHGQAAGHAASLALLRAPNRPDGVVIDDPRHAAAFLRAAADEDVDIPREIAVITCEFGDAADYTVPRLSSVDSRLSEIAERAVAAIAAASESDRIVTMDGPGFDLHKRESCCGTEPA